VVLGQPRSRGSDRGRSADPAAIEKPHQQYVAATLSRNPIALTDLWTDDAIRLGPGQPAEVGAMADLWTDDAVRFGPGTAADVGRQAIRAANERSTAVPIKVLSFVPETNDLRFWDGGAVEWRQFTVSYVASAAAEPTHVRGTVLAVLKTLPDGS
jgi:ketosteroid isomerase-like protein